MNYIYLFRKYIIWILTLSGLILSLLCDILLSEKELVPPFVLDVKLRGIMASEAVAEFFSFAFNFHIVLLLNYVLLISCLSWFFTIKHPLKA